jgi:excisionase family DNA binding protein
MVTITYAENMRQTLTVNPAHLSDKDRARMDAFLESAKERGEVVDFVARVELLTPAEVARRLGMSRSTVLRRIADGDIGATKVGTHHRIPLAEYERYSRELMHRMAEASAADIETELFGE